MPTYTLDHITDMVALRINEFPDCRRKTSAGPAATSLREMVAVALGDTACRLTRTAPLRIFAKPLDLSDYIRKNADWGNADFAEVLLPERFCRLHSLRLPGWGTTLSEEYPGDTLRCSLAEAAPEWLRSRPMRPWLRIAASPAGDSLRFGPPVATAPLMAQYIPLPRFDPDDEWLLDFDAALFTPLISLLAAVCSGETQSLSAPFTPLHEIFFAV